MSGSRLHSMREGDRSEYFAQVLLSGLGLSTPIPRQEDIGFDFLCSVADRDSGVLSFGSPYLISIKSISNPDIDLLPTESAIKNNNQDHITWLFRQELPMFLGIVDKVEFRMSIYSLIPIWFIFYEGGPDCGALTIKPRIDPTILGDVGRPRNLGDVVGWVGKKKYEVDLGHPIAVVDLDVLKDVTRKSEVKNAIRQSAYYAQLNFVHKHLGIPHFYWLAKTTPNGGAFYPAFFYLPVPPSNEASSNIMTALAPSLVSFAMHYKGAENTEALNAIAILLKEVPQSFFTKEIIESLPEIIKK